LVAACTVLAADATDAQITTVAGLDEHGPAPAVREAFLAHGAVQCGFCTPGLVVAVTDLLDRRAASSSDQHVDSASLREALAGNICRCTGYGRILAAVEELLAREPGGPSAAAESGNTGNEPDAGTDSRDVVR
jgi:carbon-monoxide dehydrogenase small subunit